jgi:hypothetical protein
VLLCVAIAGTIAVLVAYLYVGSRKDAVSTPSVLTLADAGKGCSAIHGASIEFADTAVPSSRPFTHDDACAIAVSAETGQESADRQTITGFCDVLQQSYFSHFGVDNWPDAVRRAEALPADTTPTWPQTVSQFHACADPEKVAQILASEIRLRIYSVGTAHFNGAECPAYLLELRRADVSKGDGRIYELHGLPSCPSLSVKEYPGNSPPGDILVANYHYDGALPSDFEFHGVTHPFLTKAPAAASTTASATVAVAAGALSTAQAAATPAANPTSNGSSACFDVSRHEPHSLDGRLVSVIFPEEPGFSDVRRGDTPEAGYVLQLKNSICIRSDDDDSSADPSRPIGEVQLVAPTSNAAMGAAMRSLSGLDVHVDLSAAQAEGTGHDHRPLVGSVSSIALKDAAAGSAVISRAPAPALPAGDTTSEAGTAATSVRGFYYALGQGNGAGASDFVVPEKRTAGAYSADNISSFYGPLLEPLVLTSLEPQGSGKYLVSYHFRASHRNCQGRSIVTMTTRDGLNLIEKIETLDGC